MTLKSPADAVDVYTKCVDRLEPDVTDMDQDATLTSIAISLKRIADIQEYQLEMLKAWYQNVVGRSLP